MNERPSSLLCILLFDPRVLPRCGRFRSLDDFDEGEPALVGLVNELIPDVGVFPLKPGKSIIAHECDDLFARWTEHIAMQQMRWPDMSVRCRDDCLMAVYSPHLGARGTNRYKGSSRAVTDVNFQRAPTCNVRLPDQKRLFG